MKADPSHESSGKSNSGTRVSNNYNSGNRSNSKNNDNGHKCQKGCINNEDPCPVHPNSKHTWGDCRANHYGSNYKQDKPKDDNTTKKKDGFAIDTMEHDNFVVDHALNHAGSPGEGTNNHGCFIVETMLDLDNYLTSDYVSSVPQNKDADTNYMSEVFDKTTEECFALGIAPNEIIASNSNNSDLFNLEAKKQFAPIGLMSVDSITSTQSTL